MILAVIDTNIYGSGIVGLNRLESGPGEAVRRWRQGAFILIASSAVLDEAGRTLNDRYFVEWVPTSDRVLALEGLQKYGDQVELAAVVERAASHADGGLGRRSAGYGA